jgi:hypothetical protein
MRRDDICLYLSPAERPELQSPIADRNTPRKLIWRAEIELSTSKGHGTGEIMRRADTSKPIVWHWLERCLREHVDGLKQDTETRARHRFERRLRRARRDVGPADRSVPAAAPRATGSFCLP